MSKLSVSFFVLCFICILGFSSCGEQVIPYDEGNMDTYLEPDKKDLPTSEEFSKVKEGMSFTEVVNLIGRPQRELGSGAIIYEFDLSDGTVCAVYFIPNDEGKYIVNGIMKPE